MPASADLSGTAGVDEFILWVEGDDYEEGETIMLSRLYDLLVVEYYTTSQYCIRFESSPHPAKTLRQIYIFFCTITNDATMMPSIRLATTFNQNPLFLYGAICYLLVESTLVSY